MRAVAAFLIASAIALGQVSSTSTGRISTSASGTRLGYSVDRVLVLPIKCSVGAVLFKTAAPNVGLYQCLAANTWTLVQGGATVAWGGVTGTLSDQTDLQDALDGKAEADHTHPGLYAALSHTHLAADITDFATATDAVLSSWSGSTSITTLGTISSGTVPWARLSNVPSTFAPATHAAAHASGQADAIAPSAIGAMAAVAGSGVVKVSSGTPGLVSGSASDCVRVDGSSGSCGTGTGGAAWGEITGTLAGQTDLATALNGKASTTHAASHASGQSDQITPAAIGAATSGHTHDSTYLGLHGTADLAAGLSAAYVDWGAGSGGTSIKNKPSTFAPSSHAASHASGQSDALSGTLAVSITGNAATATTLGTGSDRTKLDGIAAGATVGADWDTNVTNKPALGTIAGKNATATGGKCAQWSADGTSLDSAADACGTGGPAASPCTKYTVAYNDAALGVAATAANKAVVTLDANTKIEGITVKEQTQFAGTGITKLTISLGRTGTETEYLAAFDLLQAPSATNMIDVGGHFGATMDSHAVQARLTATGGNLNALTAGSVDVWICSVVLP